VNRGTLSVLFSVLVVATACALPGGLSGGGGSAPPELQYIFEANDNPVNVTRATLEGLRNMRSAAELSQWRGKTLRSVIPGQPTEASRSTGEAADGR